MFRKLTTYGSLVAISALVGVMIGGGPGTFFSSDGPAATLPAAISDPPTTDIATATTAPDPTTTLVATTTSSVATTSTSSSTTTTSSSTSTSTSTSTTEPPVPERPRASLVVAVANGSRVAGIAGRVADELTALGYTDIGAINAADTPTSLVYFADGFEAEAERLATDAGLADVSVAPIAEVPELFSVDTFELILVLGVDRQAAAGPPPSIEG